MYFKFVLVVFTYYIPFYILNLTMTATTRDSDRCGDNVGRRQMKLATWGGDENGPDNATGIVWAIRYDFSIRTCCFTN
jgi:hypothetical protein